MLEMNQRMFPHALNHRASILLIGSCFSDEIGRRLVQNGFQTHINPGGTLFHPLALAKMLDWAIDSQQSLSTLQRADIWLSWDLAGSFYALTEVQLQQKLMQLRAELIKALQESSHLLITFGTSWAYRLKSGQRLVANCHKQSSDHFSKENTSVEEMLQVWKELIEKIKLLNPAIKLIFTVSPVRHSRDGLHENNLSKARLLLLVEQLMTVSNCHYFPAYEIVNDQLRDYSFFKEDGVHPNSKATDYVWDFFKRYFIEPETQLVLDEWKSLQEAMSHRIMYPDSKAGILHLEQLSKRKETFFLKYPQFKPIQP
jgi:lysophospholipase L1-like esterase